MPNDMPEVKPTDKKQESAVSTSKEREKLKSKSKMFEINTLPGGKFGLLLKSSGRNIDVEKVTGNNEHNLEILVGQKKFNTARKQFRGESNNTQTFNNIPIIRNTPTKRKMNFTTVVKKVSVYSGSPCANLPDQGNEISSESPAKRQKWGQ